MAGFIKFDGVEGESQDKDHKGFCDIDEFRLGFDKPGRQETGSSRRRGDVVCDDFQVTQRFDKACPKLNEAMLNGKIFKKVEVHLTASYDSSGSSGRQTYLSYELKDMQITSFSVEAKSQSVPVVKYALNYEGLKNTYTEMDAKGSKKGNIEFTWDVEAAKK